MDGIDAAEGWLDAWAVQVNAQAELSRRVAALTGCRRGHRDGRAVLNSFDTRFPAVEREEDR